MALKILLDKRITKVEELKEDAYYVFDNNLLHLVEKNHNRFIFFTLYGTYIANRSMIETHIKEGIFTVKNS